MAECAARQSQQSQSWFVLDATLLKGRSMEMAGQMVMFARVVESGSLSAAARRLNLSTSAVSRQVAHLEGTLGIRLLTRTSHGITPTAEGEQFLKHCRQVEAEVSEAETLLDHLSGKPSGTLRILSTVAFGNVHLLPVMPRFLDQNPDISISLEMSDVPFDVDQTGIDLAIQFSEQLHDDQMIVRKLAPNRRVLVASPAYVATHGIPTTLEELDDHHCLRLIGGAQWNDWGPHHSPDHRPLFEANTADAVYRAALAGIGIARLSTYLVNEDIKTGRLVRIVPDYCQDDSSIVAIYADRRNLSPRIRAFVDFLVSCFAPIPPWEKPQPVTK